MKLTERIARWVSPNLARDSEAYHRVMMRLDEARWWLGSYVPEGASVAQYIIDDDRWYWTSKRDHSQGLPWQAPPYVTGISSFRDWLLTRPFAGRLALEQNEKEG